MFLQYILKEDKDSLLHEFFSAQRKYPQKGDWVLQITQDIKDTDLNLTFNDISEMSVDAYRSLVNRAIKSLAFKWLMSEKNKPRLNSFSKGRELKYNELKIQNYLLPNQLNIKQCKLLFSLRAQMIPVRCNYSHSYDSLTCPVCEDTAHQDTQSHILQCKRLAENENTLVKETIPYSDIYGSDVAKLSAVAVLFEKLLEKRRKILKKKEKQAK